MAYGTCSLLFCGAYHRGTGKYSKTQVIAVQPDTHLLLGREGAHTGKVPCPTWDSATPRQSRPIYRRIGATLTFLPGFWRWVHVQEMNCDALNGCVELFKFIQSCLVSFPVIFGLPVLNHFLQVRWVEAILKLCVLKSIFKPRIGQPRFEIDDDVIGNFDFEWVNGDVFILFCWSISPPSILHRWNLCFFCRENDINAHCNYGSSDSSHGYPYHVESQIDLCVCPLTGTVDN